jgi:hypothetical protein
VAEVMSHDMRIAPLMFATTRTAIPCGVCRLPYLKCLSVPAAPRPVLQIPVGRTSSIAANERPAATATEPEVNRYSKGSMDSSQNT